MNAATWMIEDALHRDKASNREVGRARVLENACESARRRVGEKQSEMKIRNKDQR
jgi:hypothetical protein